MSIIIIVLCRLLSGTPHFCNSFFNTAIFCQLQTVSGKLEKMFAWAIRKHIYAYGSVCRKAKKSDLARPPGQCTRMTRPTYAGQQRARTPSVHARPYPSPSPPPLITPPNDELHIIRRATTERHIIFPRRRRRYTGGRTMYYYAIIIT